MASRVPARSPLRPIVNTVAAMIRTWTARATPSLIGKILPPKCDCNGSTSTGGIQAESLTRLSFSSLRIGVDNAQRTANAVTRKRSARGRAYHTRQKLNLVLLNGKTAGGWRHNHRRYFCANITYAGPKYLSLSKRNAKLLKAFDTGLTVGHTSSDNSFPFAPRSTIR